MYDDETAEKKDWYHRYSVGALAHYHHGNFTRLHCDASRCEI